VRARTIHTLGLVGFLFAGCATQPKPLAIVEVSPGIFEGPKPRTQAHFDALRAKGVRTILSLEELPWDVWPERRHARRNGFRYRDVPILASPLPPSEKRVKEALLVLNDACLRPVYIHCLLGEDRSTFIIGLYRVYFQDWTPQAAWAEMLRLGFHARLTLRGFETYFWRHTQKPDWAKP
jgi:protein-tyrosine phosphatase